MTSETIDISFEHVPKVLRLFRTLLFLLSVQLVLCCSLTLSDQAYIFGLCETVQILCKDCAGFLLGYFLVAGR